MVTIIYNLIEYVAVWHLWTIHSLILTNSEVWKLLSDFSLIGHDLLAHGVSKAAESLCPDLGALVRVHMFKRYVVYLFSSPCHFNYSDRLLSQVLLQPSYSMSPTRSSNCCCQFYDGKYKAHFEKMFSSIKDWFGAMGEYLTNK
jgi:hypothetical protein